MSNLVKNIMLGLETTGFSESSAILSISAVEFNEECGITNRFYNIVDLKSCVNRGMKIDASTFMYWMGRPEIERFPLMRDGIDLQTVLVLFKSWLGEGNIQIWGNPASFSNNILRQAFNTCGLTCPFQIWDDRCYRTIVSSLPDIDKYAKKPRGESMLKVEHCARHIIDLCVTNNLPTILS